MRLTLSLADFSGTGKNIGTLNSWFISKNTPSGLTWVSEVGSVDKGDPLSMVAEIDTVNYELVTMTVTMGSTTQTGVGSSGGITIQNSGSQYTIAISSVTANVNISVTTKNLSTGVPDSGGSDSGGTGAETDLTSQFSWTPGTNVAAGGTTQTSDTNWLFSNTVDVSTYSQIRFAHIQTSNANTTLGYTFYDSSMTAVSYATNGGTSYTPIDRTVNVPSNAKYFRCMWINTTSSNYDASIHDISKFYCYGID